MKANKHFENLTPLTAPEIPRHENSVDKKVAAEAKLMMDLAAVRNNQNAGIFEDGQDILQKTGAEIKKSENKLKSFAKEKMQGFWKGLNGIKDGVKNSIDKIQYENEIKNEIKFLKENGEVIPENLPSFEDFKAKKIAESQKKQENKQTKNTESDSSSEQLNQDLQSGLEDVRNEVLAEMTPDQKKDWFRTIKKMGIDSIDKLKNLSNKDKFIVGTVALASIGLIGAGGYATLTAVGASQWGYGSFTALSMGKTVMGMKIAADGAGLAAGLAHGVAGFMGAGGFAAGGFGIHKIGKVLNKENNFKNVEIDSSEIIDIKTANTNPKSTYTSRGKSIFAKLPRNNEPNNFVHLQPIQNIINAEQINQAAEESVEPTLVPEKKPSLLDSLKSKIPESLKKIPNPIEKFRKFDQLCKQNKYDKPLTIDEIKKVVAEQNLNPELAEPTISQKELDMFLSGKELYLLNDSENGEKYTAEQIQSMLESGLIKQENVADYSTYDYSKAAEQIINGLGGESNTLVCQKINAIVMKRLLENTKNSDYFSIIDEVQKSFPKIDNPMQILEILKNNNSNSLLSKTNFSAEDYLAEYGSVLDDMKHENDILKIQSEDNVPVMEVNSTDSTIESSTIDSSIKEILEPAPHEPEFEPTLPVVEIAPQHPTTHEQRLIRHSGLREKLNALSGKLNRERSRKVAGTLEELKNSISNEKVDDFRGETVVNPSNIEIGVLPLVAAESIVSNERQSHKQSLTPKLLETMRGLESGGTIKIDLDPEFYKLSRTGKVDRREAVLTTDTQGDLRINNEGAVSFKQKIVRGEEASQYIGSLFKIPSNQEFDSSKRYNISIPPKFDITTGKLLQIGSFTMV